MDKRVIDYMKNHGFPGSYYLSKSMEIGKTNSSGTLWFLKKFLVLYYYIFLAGEDILKSADFKRNIEKAFDQYIDSIGKGKIGKDTQGKVTQEKAKEFFYSNKKWLDVRSEEFLGFNSFACFADKLSQKDQSGYYERAKKCYFARLITSDNIENDDDAKKTNAQLKNYLKEIRKETFKYDDENKQNAILNNLNWWINYCYKKDGKFEPKTKEEDILKNYNEVIQKELESNKCLKNDFLRTMIRSEKRKMSDFNKFENDMLASTRNQRQLLFYYGFFYTNLEKKEKYDLTIIGELALQANYYELLAIWEQQKNKILSRTVDIDIKFSAEMSQNNEKDAGIDYSPYFRILSFINANEEIKPKVYRYVIARINEKSPLIKDYKVNKQELKEIEDSINNRKLQGIKEDFSKELVKYLFGLEKNEKFDMSTNPLACISNKKINNRYIFNNVYKITGIINDYKRKVYSDLFKSQGEEINKYFEHKKDKKKYTINQDVKDKWYEYIIFNETFIMFLEMILIVLCLEEKDIEDFLKGNIDDIIVKSLSDNFSKILESIGVSSKQRLQEYLQNIENIINEKAYLSWDCYIETDQVAIKPTISNKREEDLLKILKEESDKYQKDAIEEVRTRNTKLRTNLLVYYWRFANNNNKLELNDEKLKSLCCECCNKPAFLSKQKVDDKDMLPYLEVHHLIPFKEKKGPDHYLNLFALCPNCHMRLHHASKEIQENCFKNISKRNLIGKSIYSRLEELLKENKIDNVTLLNAKTMGIISKEERKQLEKILNK